MLSFGQWLQQQAQLARLGKRDDSVGYFARDTVRIALRRRMDPQTPEDVHMLISRESKTGDDGVMDAYADAVREWRAVTNQRS